MVTFVAMTTAMIVMVEVETVMTTTPLTTTVVVQ